MEESNAPNRRGAHRRVPLAEKRRMVELTLHAGASVLAIAREHGVSRANLYEWKALYRAGKLTADPTLRRHSNAPGTTFLPVTVAAVDQAPQSCAEATTPVVHVVHLTLVSGAMLRIETGALDAGLLCALLAALQR